MVLVVDDDQKLLRALRRTLQAAGFGVLACTHGEEALTLVEAHPISAIVLDLRMPGMTGQELFWQLRRRGVSAPVLICSSHGAHAARRELGAEGSIEKPFYPDQLVTAVKRVLAA